MFDFFYFRAKRRCLATELGVGLSMLECILLVGDETDFPGICVSTSEELLMNEPLASACL
ncbi:unnamed protein product [Meloidogyne enterolobii]|uniref:Uncharacterized protein n=1 Tax=Meloidogyne enterolobii TaxID=390850 RepID=A0ACB1A6M1_MELEN